MKFEIQEKLEQLAFKNTTPFCYGCYKDAPSGRCDDCGSDDLMRHLRGVGCEYGTEWVIKSILESELTPVDMEDAFDEFVRQCYPEEVKVGWMTFDAVDLMKSQDPISWRVALSDWESEQSQEESIVSFDGGANYYNISDIENLLSENDL